MGNDARAPRGLTIAAGLTLAWFTTDFRLASGHTLVDLFIEREGGRLRSGERRDLERLYLTHLRPCEVLAVRLDEGFDLLDLWTRLDVADRDRPVSEEIEVLRIVTERLDAAGMPYMVTGSMALGLYAVPRMTRGIDLVVALSADDAEARSTPARPRRPRKSRRRTARIRERTRTIAAPNSRGAAA
ncbi:MAG TPA: hypothetical protein VMR23_15270 [Candidatus Limnocylindria bacterium]|nr:hypothetical protein [Candidatus Limnocylindria bacterium]